MENIRKFGGQFECSVTLATVCLAKIAQMKWLAAEFQYG